jgi:Tfp pilus assembly protein FimT
MFISPLGDRERGVLFPKTNEARKAGQESAEVGCMNEWHVTKNSRGFSLIELAISLSMVIIMAAVSIPMLTSAMRGIKLSSDAKSIATSMTYARVSAASQVTRYRMSIGLDSNQWSLSKWDRTSETYELEQATNTLSGGVSNSGIRFKSTSSTAPTGFPTTSTTQITFDSRGIPIEGAGIVYLSGKGGDFAVSVSMAGKIQVWRYQNSKWSMN